MNRFALALFVAGCAPVAAGAATVSISQLDLSQLDPVRRLVTGAEVPAGKHPVAIAGKTFEDGFGTWGPGSLRLSLDGHARTLTAWVGVNDDSKDPGPVWYEVIADGRMAWESDPIRAGDAARPINLSLEGMKTVILVVQAPDRASPDIQGRYSQQGAHSAWADAMIAYDGAAPVAVEAPAEPPYILTPKPPAIPRLNGATVVGARPRHPFLFTIPATGERPMAFAAYGLPDGLKLDAATGRITGAVARAGEYQIRIVARNRRGVASRQLRIVIGDNLALTPPMGWNDWNYFGLTITAADVRAAADALVSTGLIEHGWTYVNIDDHWTTRPQPGDPVVRMLDERSRAEGGAGFSVPPETDPTLVGPARDAAGGINANRRFPDMTGLARYIHSRGLKAGLYSSPGPLTCGGCIASYGHEAEDAERFAEWGFDYLKYDWCTYGLYGRITVVAEAVKPYRTMGEALRAQPRDIVYSLCQYGKADVWQWGASVNGNCWRTTNDISDTWSSVSGIGFSQNGRGAYAGPGHWNDADMLVVGRMGWGRNPHLTHLTPDEQYTHVSLWSLLASPLLIGCDLAHLDDFTLSLLTNDEVLAVDQDPLGRPAHRVWRDRDVEVWARPLADGSLAVGLFNRGEIPARVAARWPELGLSGASMVRDLWRQQDLGQFSESFAATVPRHGVVLVKITPGS